MDLKIELEDRILWADGSISVSPENLIDYFFKLSKSGNLDKLYVTNISNQVKEFNKISEIPLSIKKEINLSTINWNIPDKYKYLNLDEYLLSLANKIENDELYETRLKRLAYEIYIFKEFKFDIILKCLIYIIDTFKENNQVWGVGRGSSCSSYLLYLLEVHDVDSVKYNIDLSDFIKGI